MPSFAYRGRNGSGELVQGTLEGLSAGVIADTLFGRGVTPIEIKALADKPEAGGALSFNRDISIGFLGDRIGPVDVLLFSRQMHTLMRAGVPIMRALAGLQESSVNTAMQKMLLDLRLSLDAGRELSLSLARHPKVFNPFYLSMVRVGELTGRLEEAFIRLFGHLEFEHFMRTQVKSALRYPAFVVIAIVIAMIVLNMMVIPAFAQVFKGFNTELPLMTRILIGVSAFVVEYWPHLLAGSIMAFIGGRIWVRTKRGRYLWDRFKIKLPVAGKVIEKATLARYARSFALAARSGIPVTHALSNVAGTVDNAYISAKIEGMRDAVERGETILRASIGAGVFTPVVIQMIAVGEESGALEDMMQEVAEMYQSEVEYDLKTLVQQIEPILISFLGLLVLVLALGIFLPVWDLGRAAIRKGG